MARNVPPECLCKDRVAKILEDLFVINRAEQSEEDFSDLADSRRRGARSTLNGGGPAHDHGKLQAWKGFRGRSLGS